MKPLLFLTLCAALPLSGKEKITYEDHIFPIFEQSCLNCHNPSKKKGDLDLSSYSAAMTGGSGGKVAFVGEGASSKLYTVTVGTEEPVMPPEGDQIERKAANLIRAWIDGGLLETKDSSARKSTRPKFELTIDSSAGKPEGPPPMPAKLSLDPSFVTPRAGLVKAMTASPWAPLIALTGQKQILLYHSENFRFLGSLPFPKGQPEAVSFHPSGKYLLASGGVAGKSGQVIAWDITTGKELFTAGREFDSILAAAVTPDLSTVALGGPSRLLKVWHTRENEEAAAIKKHTDWITALAAAPNGKFFASGDRNGGIHVWDIDGNEIHALRDHQKGVTALAFRSDSKLLASTGEDGQLIIWDLKKGNAAKKINAHNGGATALFYHRDGHIVTAGRDKIVRIYKPNFQEKTSFKNLPEIITAVSLSENGKHLFAAAFNGEVLAYDTSSNQAPIANLESNPPTLNDRLAYLQQKLDTQSRVVEKSKADYTKKNEVTLAHIKRIANTKDALKKNESILKQLELEQKKQEAKAKELANKSTPLKQLVQEAKQKKKNHYQSINKLQKQIQLTKKEKKDFSAQTTQIVNIKNQITEVTEQEEKLALQRNQLNEERKKIGVLLSQNRQRKRELQDLVREGKTSLKGLEKQLPNLTKLSEEPKKIFQQNLSALEDLKTEFQYWKQAQ